MAIWLLVIIGAWRLNSYLQQSTGTNPDLAVAIPLALAVVGGWIAFRLVNLPELCRLFDRRRSGDEQGLLADAG